MCKIYFSTFVDYLSKDPNSIIEKLVLLENIRYYPEETEELPTTLDFHK